MATKDDKKFFQYSLSFYQKEKELSEVIVSARMGFTGFDRSDKLLKPKSAQIFLNFASGGKSAQQQQLSDEGEAVMEALFDILRHFSSDRDLVQFLLTTVDAVLTEERAVLREVVRDVSQNRFGAVTTQLRGFLSLDNHHEVTYIAAARVCSLLLGQLPREGHDAERRNLMMELLQVRRGQSRVRISDYGLLTCFVHLIKHAELAQLFLEQGGTVLLLDCLTRTGSDTQLIYYALLNVWLLSFVEQGVNKFIGSPRVGVIRTICEVLQKVSRQKIVRVAFMIFQAVSTRSQCLELMLDSRLLRTIQTVLKGSLKDVELLQKIKDLNTILENSVHSLSSFDKYLRELNSQMLEWSSVHTQRFWKDNAMRCEANDYQVFKKLKTLFFSKRPLNVAIACYDVGEFCRFYPRGKAVVEAHGLKDLIMEKARFSEDKLVKEQALLALQKILIHNWQSI